MPLNPAKAYTCANLTNVRASDRPAGKRAPLVKDGPWCLAHVVATSPSTDVSRQEGLLVCEIALGGGSGVHALSEKTRVKVPSEDCLLGVQPGWPKTST